jgi:hypothetical protein
MRQAMRQLDGFPAVDRVVGTAVPCDTVPSGKVKFGMDMSMPNANAGADNKAKTAARGAIRFISFSYF